MGCFGDVSSEIAERHIFENQRKMESRDPDAKILDEIGMLTGGKNPRFVEKLGKDLQDDVI